MTDTSITDLDTLVPADKKVLLKGRTYVLPGDMPLEIYLRVNRASQMQDAGADAEELLRDMVAALVDLFCWTLPKDDGESREHIKGVLMGLGLRTVTQLLGRIYPVDEEGDGAVDADAEVPTPTATNGTTTPTADSQPSPSAS